jgi:hypothetical protein
MLYLRGHYSPPDAEERRERVVMVLKRLVRARRDPARIHAALLRCIDAERAHGQTQMSLRTAQQHNARVRRAADAVQRALASLRALVPPGAEFLNRHFDDEAIFSLRHELLRAVDVEARPAPRGRPRREWTHALAQHLRREGVGDSDRRELMGAFGFIDEEHSSRQRPAK